MVGYWCDIQGLEIDVNEVLGCRSCTYIASSSYGFCHAPSGKRSHMLYMLAFLPLCKVMAVNVINLCYRVLYVIRIGIRDFKVT